MKALVLNLMVLIFVGGVFAQNDSTFKVREGILYTYLNELRESKNDSEKFARNKIFKDYLFETIQLKGAMDYPFSSLKTIGTIKSDDKSVRLFNWNIEQADNSQVYYCYILHKDLKSHEVKVSELVDNSFALPLRPTEILDAKNWYGALYYKIVSVKKGNKTLYTLLGYDANTTMSNIKLIDVLTFSGNNPKLGSPIFKIGKQTENRLFYEHSEQAYMSLKYEPEYERIIFDHLSPESPSMEGFYSYYVPDFSYDALKFEKGKWTLHEDVVGVNKKEDNKIVVHVQNPKTGKVEEVEYKGKWIDPSDPNAIGGNNHVASLPTDEENRNKNRIDTQVNSSNPNIKNAQPNKKIRKREDSKTTNSYVYSEKKKRRRK